MNYTLSPRVCNSNTPKLRAWVLDVPPIRIQSNELGATRTDTDRSLRVRVLKLFFQQNPEYTNTQQGLPDQGYT